MKILSNRKIKNLFIQVVSFITIGTVILTFFPYWKIGIFFIFALILFSLYRYFKEENEVMEEAVTQITEYISGNRDARLACNEEGELYRLFHEVNSLVSILNAHVQKEGAAKRFLRDTISDISHQLKTPIAALNVYNGILQEETEKNPTLSEFVLLSEQELDRMETLVQSLLKITKLDAGTLVMEKNVENISELMDDIRKQFDFRAVQEEKYFLFSGDESITLLCDRTWLQEALRNIVRNAFEHTQKGDTISVEWRQFASIVQFVIKDDGSGIHPEDLYHIFKRFYRSRFSKDTQGVGLGLPLARMIVEAHNGTIEVNSELGRGSTFTITFLIPTEL